MNNQTLLVIVGQTASGKSGLAMRIAKKYDGEIIAADSRTVYKGLDIGTAKPSAADMAEVPHHLVDVADYKHGFTVADFKNQANKAIDDIRSRGRLPVMVGGSGLYVNSVVFDYDLGGEPDVDLRKELEATSIEALQQRIVASGLTMPENKQNKRYLERVIERGNAAVNTHMRADALVVGLHIEKSVLERRIRDRLQQMLDDGLIEEVRRAYRVYPEGSEALKGNIYRVLYPYFQGQKNLEECLEDFVKLDLRLAKRQITWFKRNKNISWFTNADDAYSFIESYV